MKERAVPEELPKGYHMKLKDAYLCLDCDTIFSVTNQTNPSCPSCTSRSYEPLAGWISTMNVAEHNIERAVEIEREPEVKPFVLPQLVPDTLADRARRAGM